MLEPLARELNARALAVDLVEPSEVDRLASEAGEVDILIANAALPATGALESFTMHEIDRALAVNLRAPIALTHALMPAMVARGRGHLVYISSLSGKAATPVSLMYTTTKFGLRGFAAGLRIDLRGSGVGVTTVLPGFIRDAGMFADRRRGASADRRHAHTRGRRASDDSRDRAQQGRDRRRPPSRACRRDDRERRPGVRRRPSAAAPAGTRSPMKWPPAKPECASSEQRLLARWRRR